MASRIDTPLDKLPTHAPYLLSWSSAEGCLPMRKIASTTRARGIAMRAPPYWSSGPTHEPFDFCGHMHRLCTSIVASTEELRHIDMSRVLITITAARSRREYGLQARVTPLRFRSGRLLRRQNGVQYQVQRYFVDGREVLYLMTYCLPRFLELDFDEKMITILHELYHIGPKFDGDLRRHHGRCHMHTSSKKNYDEQMAHLARGYLSKNADASKHDFLRLRYDQLQARHGAVVGIVVPRPRILPLPVGTPS